MTSSPSYRQTVEAGVSKAALQFELDELERDLQWFEQKRYSITEERYFRVITEIRSEILTHKLELEALEVGA